MESLKWVREYDRSRGPMTRKIIQQTVQANGGTYLLKSSGRGRAYTVSFTDTNGRSVDLGGYETKRECEQRISRHRDTGR